MLGDLLQGSGEIMFVGRPLTNYRYVYRLSPNLVRNDQWEFQDPKMEVRQYHFSGHMLGVYPRT